MALSIREQKIPGPDHPITLAPSGTRLVARVGDKVIADSTKAVNLNEAGYPPVPYFPLADVDGEVLVASEKHTYCPYKGEASYYSVKGPDGEVADAAWFYPEPYAPVGEIAGHVAFYGGRIVVTEEA